MEATRKAKLLLELARRRQAARWHPYQCISDFDNGAHECDFVSPYTKSAHNVNASLMVLLQDWASVSALEGEHPLQAMIDLGHDPARHTNKRLKKLLCEHFEYQLDDTYATNVFPFIKPGGMGAKLPPRDMRRAAEEFALPQIRIVSPRIAVCLGIAAFNAVATAAGQRKADRIGDAISNPFRFNKTQIWCQRHPGRAGVDRVRNDWARMSSAHEEIGSRERFEAVLAKVPDVEPEEHDRLPMPPSR